MASSTSGTYSNSPNSNPSSGTHPTATNVVPSNASAAPTSNTASSHNPSLQSASIAVGSKPDIIVKIKDAVRLIFVGSERPNISAGTVAIPYTKEGNKVTIDLSATVVQSLEIDIPRQANLDLSMEGGNVVIDTFEGRATIALTSGTIGLKNFIPHGTNTINLKAGTINIAFAHSASCGVKAQTNVGAIVSSYTAIREQRSKMEAEAAGTIGSGTGAMVNLTTGYGSITIGAV